MKPLNKNLKWTTFRKTEILYLLCPGARHITFSTRIPLLCWKGVASYARSLVRSCWPPFLSGRPSFGSICNWSCSGLYTVNSFKCTYHSAKFIVQSKKCIVCSSHGTVNSELWTMNSARWTVNSKFWTGNNTKFIKNSAK